MGQRFLVIICFFLSGVVGSFAQNKPGVQDSLQVVQDAVNEGQFQVLVKESKEKHILDSLLKEDLKRQIAQLQESNKVERRKLQGELQDLVNNDSIQKASVLAKIDSLKKVVVGSPVRPFQDTIFTIYVKSGSSKSIERAENVSRKIQDLYDDEFLKIDSIRIEESEYTVDIIYGDLIVTSISDLDAQWDGRSKQALAADYLARIQASIEQEKADNSMLKIATRIGLVMLIAFLIGMLIYGIKKLYLYVQSEIIAQRDKRIKDLTIQNYTLISSEQGLKLALSVLNVVRWFLILLLLFLTLPLVFSVFPFTHSWAGQLFSLLWTPFKGLFVSLWGYFPKLITIVIIYLVMRYFIRLVRYIFGEIDLGKLEINGFHRDWAMPTFSIVKLLLYAFMLVLIYPFLPNSNSDVFKGVSVFIGVLFSLGSSSAIANMVAGLVITYMRPFQIGDKIKTGGVTGVVIEKTILVTRLKTISNEEITIPNSAVLSGNTINYSTFGATGISIHVSVSIGYDVPWKNVHEALLEAASRIDVILQEPKPFVLQTSLDDFYVSYVLCVYISDPGKDDAIKSLMYQQIQDVCIEKGIEIMSPHYLVNLKETQAKASED